MSLQEVGPHTYLLDKSHVASRLITKNYRWYTPAFSPRDIPIFADVSSITESPETMKAIRDFLVARYRAMPQPPTHILGFDARGFLFGPMIAVELGIPFVLMRKADKSAGLLKSEPYEKDYKEAAPEVMTVRIGSIGEGSRVLLIDDVLATGGTSTSGLQLVEASGATLVELVFLLFVPSLGGVEKIHAFANGRFKSAQVLSFVSDDAIAAENCGDAKDYTGPRVVSCAAVQARAAD